MRSLIGGFAGIEPARREWGWEIKDKDPRGRYGYWTNYIYRYLSRSVRDGCGHHEGVIEA